MNIFKELLTPERTLWKVTAKSKKRVFEVLSETFSSGSSHVTPREIYEHLLARERLGSTALGMGIAIPHCRAHSCNAPVGVMATLETNLDFDSPDGNPVDLLFALIVPHEAHQDHLDILSEVTKLFSYTKLCDQLRTAKDSVDLFRISTEWHIDS